MNEFKKGDKVRLNKSCYKMPEWAAMDRPQRKQLCGLTGCELSVTRDCSTRVGNIHVCPVLSEGFYCIPAALLELAEPTKIATAVVDEMHDHKPVAKRRPDVGEWVVFDRPCILCPNQNYFGDLAKPLRIVAHDKDSSCLSAFYVQCDGPGSSRADSSDRPIAKPVYYANSLDQYHVVPTPTLHSYTPEQIAEARDIVYRLMTDKNCLTSFYVHSLPTHFLDLTDEPNRDKPHTIAKVLSVEGCDYGLYREVRRAVAYCQPTDVWSDDIGRMVALCKLMGEPLPAWVKGGKST